MRVGAHSSQEKVLDRAWSHAAYVSPTCLRTGLQYSRRGVDLSTRPLMSAVSLFSSSTVKLTARAAGCRVWETTTLRGSVGPVTSSLPAASSAPMPVTRDITSAMPAHREAGDKDGEGGPPLCIRNRRSGHGLCVCRVFKSCLLSCPVCMLY